MKLEYTEITVQDLIRFAQKDRSIALPEFQRPFVWDEEDVAEMLRTMINDWPSGNVLMIGSKELIGRFKVTALAGAPTIVSDEKVKMLILDGQQRLTSVFQTLTNNSKINGQEFVFYVDMRRIHEQDGFDDDCLNWKKGDDFPNEQDAADKLWVPMHTLYSELAFGKWLDLIPENLRERMEALADEHLWPIRSYKFPSNTLPSDLEFRSLVRIFDKLNRQGQELKTFDLLVALLLPEGFKLRERAEDAATVFAGIGNGFKIDPIEITKLIALEENLRQIDANEPVTVGGIREDDVLDLVDQDSARISAEWDGAVERFAGALTFLNDRCGAVTNNLLPQTGFVLALAVGLAIKDPRDHWEEDLERWAWSSFFTQAYAQGVNTRAVADAAELRKWADDAEKAPTAIRDLEIRPERVQERLRDSRKGNKTFERGLMALLVADGAKDWLTPKKQGESQELLLHEGAIDFHHVFPDGYLTDRGRPSEMMVNFTPLKASTNRSIGKSAPSGVLELTRFDSDALVKHRIELDALEADRVEDYIAARGKELAALIASTVGISKVAAADGAVESEATSAAD